MSACRLVVISRGISTKQELLREIANKLNFPSYFGFNWDALDESLADLSWLSESEICIWHEDIPLSASPTDASRYLKVLDAVLREHGEKRLLIDFPEEKKAAIDQMLGSWKNCGLASNAGLVIYVQLLDEGTTVFRPTAGTTVGDRLVRLEATPDYDPEDEQWEFLPGTVVECEKQTRNGEEILVAVRSVKSDA